MPHVKLEFVLVPLLLVSAWGLPVRAQDLRRGPNGGVVGDLDDVSLADVVLRLADVEPGLSLVVSSQALDELRRARVTLRLNGAPAVELIEQLLDMHGVDYDTDGDPQAERWTLVIRSGPGHQLESLRHEVQRLELTLRLLELQEAFQRQAPAATAPLEASPEDTATPAQPAGADLDQARALMDEGQRGRALELVEARLLTHPQDAAALALKSRLVLIRDRLGLAVGDLALRREARDLADQALALDPGVALAWLTLADLDALQGGDRERAERAIARALELDPQLIEAQLLRARLWARNGDAAAAMQVCEQLLQRQPDCLEALLFMAQLAIHTQQFDSARSVLDRLIEQHPALPEPYYLRGLSFLRQPTREYQRGLEDLSHALTLRPDFADALFFRAAGLLDLRKYEEALRDLAWAEQAAGTFPMGSLLLLRGHCHFEREEWAEASEAYQGCLAASPSQARVRQMIEQRLEQCRQRLAQDDGGSRPY
jgi:tetratricopeptide (TPR) repeat protein